MKRGREFNSKQSIEAASFTKVTSSTKTGPVRRTIILLISGVGSHVLPNIEGEIKSGGRETEKETETRGGRDGNGDGAEAEGREGRRESSDRRDGSGDGVGASASEQASKRGSGGEREADRERRRTREA